MSSSWMRITRAKLGEWMAVVSAVEQWTGGGRILLTWRAARIELNQVAVFASRKPTSEGSVWFSPAIVPLAAALLAAHGAEPSERPERSEVTLLFAGDQDAAWQLLSAP